MVAMRRWIKRVACAALLSYETFGAMGLELPGNRNPSQGATHSPIDSSGSVIRFKLADPSPEEMVFSIAFSPDGSVLAAGSGHLLTSDHSNQDVCLWQLPSGRLFQQLRGHKGPVRSVAFSPDGSNLASGGYDHTVRLWDVTTGATIATLPGHTGPVNSVAYSPDGKTLASAGDDYRVRLWEVKRGREIASCEGHEAPVSCISFSPNGAFLASASGDGSVRLWDVGRGSELLRIEPERGPVYAVAFSPDGQILACAARFASVSLWSVTSKPGKLIGRIGPGTGSAFDYVPCLAFTPDGDRLLWVSRTACSEANSVIHLSEVATGKELSHVQEASSDIYCLTVCPEGRLLASGSGNSVLLRRLSIGSKSGHTSD
jgi:WD40 repeat protein